MLQITGQCRKKKWSHWQTIADKLHINTITALNQYVQFHDKYVQKVKTKN